VNKEGVSMSGNNQKPEAKRRVVPSIEQGNSRVSRAAGGVGAKDMQKAKVEQRSQIPASRQGARGQASAKKTQRGKQDQRSRKGASSNRSPVAVATLPPRQDDPRDTKFIQWAHEKWSSLDRYQQQIVFSSLLLLLSITLFGALTVFRTTPVLSLVADFFMVFFGWSSYLLALGLIAYSLAHLIEGMRRIEFIRWSVIIGILVLWLLILIESRLLFGKGSAGALAEFAILPFLGWSPAIGHVLLIGSVLLVTIVTFRIKFGHILMVAGMIHGLFPSKKEEEKPSPYRGQRPRYSRYAGGTAASEGSSAPPVPKRAGRRSAVAEGELEQAILEDDDNADELIDFEADFDEQEDPLDDINIHKQKIGQVVRGAHPVPPPLDVSEHSQATKGANQQALPFESASVPGVKPGGGKGDQMEPLAPNPRLVGQKKAKAQAPNQPQIVSSWKLPELTLLNNPESVKLQLMGEDIGALARIIQETLRSFRVDAEVRQEDISVGPTIIRFGIRPTGKPEMKMDDKTGKMMPVRDAAGNIIYETRTRVSRIMALQNDLALVMEAKTIRMEAPVPGRPYVGVEIPNKNGRLVTLREILESKEYQAAKNKSKLAMALGRDVAGSVRVADLARMPHLLIAGATGSGKSVMINTLIAGLLTQATPDDVRMLMVDPKMVELSMYNGIPHLLSPVVTEVDKVVPLLKNAINEMERRYRLFSQLGVRNLDGYRKMRLEKIAKGDTSLNNLPSIVIIIDELADLMMAAPEEVESMICRLAQLARATGIHLVIATQRPSVDVITGLIKANIPTRISFMVSSAVDSRTIIDMGGAERLLGRGDMLYLPADAGRPERIQAAFLSDEEASTLADYWQQQASERLRAEHADAPAQEEGQPAVEPGWEIKELPSDDFDLDDDLLDRAEEVVREYGRASISLLQRRLRIGYSRAARLIDLLEERGIIGQFEPGGRAREVLESNGGYARPDDSSGHTLADEADDIIAEEQARNEFLKKQAAAQRLPPQGPGQAN
jgi:ribosomal protein S25/archaellum biogenesis ATPase FlaH